MALQSIMYTIKYTLLFFAELRAIVIKSEIISRQLYMYNDLVSRLTGVGNARVVRERRRRVELCPGRKKY